MSNLCDDEKSEGYALLFGITSFDLSGEEPEHPTTTSSTTTAASIQCNYSQCTVAKASPIPPVTPSTTETVSPPNVSPPNVSPPKLLQLPSSVTSRAFILTPTGINPPPLICLTMPQTGSFMTTPHKIKKGQIIFTEKSKITSSTTELKHCHACHKSLMPASTIAGLSFPSKWPPSSPLTCPNSNPSCPALFCSPSCSSHYTSLLPLTCCTYTSLKNLLKSHPKSSVLNLSLKLFFLSLKSPSILSNLCGDAGDPIPSLSTCSEYYVEIHPHVTHLISSSSGSDLWSRCLSVCFRNGFSICTRSPFTEYYSNVIRGVGRGSKGHVEAIKSVTRWIDEGRETLERGDQEYVDREVRVECECLFTMLAKVNHCCEGNAEVRGGGFVDDTMDLVARRDIEAGEEITISYIMGGEKEKEERRDKIKRREALRDQYCFVCNCHICKSI